MFFFWTALSYWLLELLKQIHSSTRKESFSFEKILLLSSVTDKTFRTWLWITLGRVVVVGLVGWGGVVVLSVNRTHKFCLSFDLRILITPLVSSVLLIFIVFFVVFVLCSLSSFCVLCSIAPVYLVCKFWISLSVLYIDLQKTIYFYLIPYSIMSGKSFNPLRKSLIICNTSIDVLVPQRLWTIVDNWSLDMWKHNVTRYGEWMIVV